MKKTVYVLLAFFALTLSGCGQKSEAPSSPESSTAPAAQASVSSHKTVDSATAGTIRGRVIFDGTAPEPKKLSVKGNPECAVFHPGGEITSEELVVNNGAIKNAFVYIKSGLESYSFPVPSEAATVENKDCHYVPHVSGVQANQPINFVNNDPTLHNFHAYPKNSKPFNMGLPFQNMKQVKKFEAAEVMVPLKCDMHPWILNYISILNHPYFAVTGEDGSFELKNVPPGTYTVEVWQEKLGVRSQEVTIEPQGTKEIEFKYAAS
jgi:plastocyanin/predicted small lipoprotein YifL